MKYQLNMGVPSLTVHVAITKDVGTQEEPRKQVERAKVVLLNGEHDISSADFKLISSVDAVVSLVRDGNLRFRDSRPMEEIFGTTRKDYEARIAAQQDQQDRRDNPPVSEDVTELTRLVANMQTQMDDMAERHAQEIADVRKEAAASAAKPAAQSDAKQTTTATAAADKPAK